MAELSETLVASTEFAGKYKLIVFTAAIGSASDTVVLTEAQTGCTSIAAIVGHTITAGADAALQSLMVSFSALTVTIVSHGEGGTSATDWTGAAVSISLLGNTST